jgi:hypothetical protein
MRLRALGGGEHHKGGTGSAIQLTKPRDASASRLKGSLASRVFDAIREQGTTHSVSLSPILYLKTADSLEITVCRDHNGSQGVRCRRNPEIVLI